MNSTSFNRHPGQNPALDTRPVACKCGGELRFSRHEFKLRRRLSVYVCEDCEKVERYGHLDTREVS